MARHLVDPICGSRETAEVRDALQKAHAFLVDKSKDAARQLLDLATSDWGQRAKRVYVPLSGQGKPLNVSAESVPLAEVINQCATLERLLDVLTWAADDVVLKSYKVVVCHPTTSSGNAVGPDNDLVLIGPESALARFEVSDVASDKDGNGKEEKDLVSLGVLRDGSGDARYEVEWPAARVFLAVSEEFGRRLVTGNRHGVRDGKFHYSQRGTVGTTWILEVLQGRRSGSA